MKTNIVADSSFYICFLDDIADPNTLILFVNRPEFTFISSNIIAKKIKESLNLNNIEEEFNSGVSIFSYYDYGAIIKPFFSENEILKGEHEVIVISYIFYYLEKSFFVILDEIWARNNILFNSKLLDDEFKRQSDYFLDNLKIQDYISKKTMINEYKNGDLKKDLFEPQRKMSDWF